MQPPHKPVSLLEFPLWLHAWLACPPWLPQWLLMALALLLLQHLPPPVLVLLLLLLVL